MALPTGKKMSDLLRQKSTWAKRVADAGIRWFKSPYNMKPDSFDLSKYASCIGFVPLNRITGQRHQFAFQMLFDKSHQAYKADFEMAGIVISKKGNTFHAMHEADIWKPDCKLYLSNIPFDIDLEDLKNTLEKYVEFKPYTEKIYHFVDGKFSGQMMLVVGEVRTVPAKSQRVKTGPHENVGFKVTVRGQCNTVAKEQVSKPCFCCKSLDHEVKDCPKKKTMTFRWKCTKCGLSAMRCYEDHCAMTEMVKEVKAVTTGFLAKDGKVTTKYLETNKATIKEKMEYLCELFDKMRAFWRTQSTTPELEKLHNDQGLALKRDFREVLDNYKTMTRGVWDYHIYQTYFETEFAKRLTLHLRDVAADENTDHQFFEMDEDNNLLDSSMARILMDFGNGEE